MQENIIIGKIFHVKDYLYFSYFIIYPSRECPSVKRKPPLYIYISSYTITTL